MRTKHVMVLYRRDLCVYVKEKYCNYFMKVYNIRKYVERSTYMTWKTENLHLMKGSVLAVDGDSALFFRNV